MTEVLLDHNLIYKITEYLEVLDIMKLSKVCKRLHQNIKPISKNLVKHYKFDESIPSMNPIFHPYLNIHLDVVVVKDSNHPIINSWYGVYNNIVPTKKRKRGICNGGKQKAFEVIFDGGIDGKIKRIKQWYENGKPNTLDDNVKCKYPFRMKIPHIGETRVIYDLTRVIYDLHFQDFKQDESRLKNELSQFFKLN